MFLLDTDNKKDTNQEDSFNELVEDFFAGFKEAADKEKKRKKEEKQNKKLEEIKNAVED